MKKKIALFCDVDARAVINNETVARFTKRRSSSRKKVWNRIVLEKLGLEDRHCDMDEWTAMVNRIKETDASDKEINIALVGKYVALHDAYLSVVESLHHAGYANGVQVKIKWIDSEELEKLGVNLDEVFGDISGIVIPGGFGSRGVEGKIATVR